MSRKRILRVGAACILVAGAILFVWPKGPKEPQYQGRKLSEWLALYRSSPWGTPEKEKAVTAFRMMSNEVIPVALKAIRANDLPRWKTGLRRALTFSLHGNKWMPKRLLNSLWKEPGNEGASCFSALGTNGAPAIPALEAIVSRGDQRPSWLPAMQSITWTGLAALPALTRIATNRTIHVQTRRLALAAIGDFSTNAAACLPSLQPEFTDPELIIREETTNTFNRVRLVSAK